MLSQVIEKPEQAIYVWTGLESTRQSTSKAKN